MPRLSFQALLPVHNIEATIRGMYRELSDVAQTGVRVCEDGSKDNSKQVLRQLAVELQIRENLSEERRGYSKAMREGMGRLSPLP